MHYSAVQFHIYLAALCVLTQHESRFLTFMQPLSRRYIRVAIVQIKCSTLSERFVYVTNVTQLAVRLWFCDATKSLPL